MQLELQMTGSANTVEFFFKLPMLAEVGDAGACKVILDGEDSVISSGTYTFANATDGNTSTTINDTITFNDTDTIEDITIEESAIEALKDGSPATATDSVFKLKLLDSDFAWDVSNLVVTRSGGFEFNTTQDTNEDTTSADGDVYLDTSDAQILKITIDNLYGGDNSATARGKLVLSGLQVNPDSDASFGEVKFKIYEDATTETLTIGTYTDYTVTVEAADDEEDLPTIYAGDMAVVSGNEPVDGSEPDAPTTTLSSDDDLIKLSVLEIDEEVADSWQLNRTTTIEFPEWVNVVDIEIDDDTTDINVAANQTTDSAESAILGQFDWKAGDSKVEFNGLYAITESGTLQTANMDIQFYVNVEADAPAGDITATVSGRGFDEDYEVVLGKAARRAEATIEVTDVRIGLQDQKIGKITIE
jgi:hypothetical protein